MISRRLSEHVATRRLSRRDVIAAMAATVTVGMQARSSEDSAMSFVPGGRVVLPEIRPTDADDPKFSTKQPDFATVDRQFQTGCTSGKIAWGRSRGAACNLATASLPVMTSPKNIMNVLSAAPCSSSVRVALQSESSATL
jgi:hypothetical protein